MNVASMNSKGVSCAKSQTFLQDDSVIALQASASDQEGNGEEGSPKRLRPNPKFLNNVVSSISRTNQRLIAESTANAACKVASFEPESHERI